MSDRKPYISRFIDWIWGDDEEDSTNKVAADNYSLNQDTEVTELRATVALISNRESHLHGKVTEAFSCQISGSNFITWATLEDDFGKTYLIWYGVPLLGDLENDSLYEVRGMYRGYAGGAEGYIVNPKLRILSYGCHPFTKESVRDDLPFDMPMDVLRTRVLTGISGGGRWSKDFIGKPLDPTGNWGKLRQKILERDNYKCTNCKSEENLTVDHIKPLSLGGLNEPSNLQTLCKDCHEDKHYNKFLERGFDADDSYGEGYKLNAKIKKINEAIKSRSKLNINYIDRDGKKTRRTIYPEDIYKGFETRDGRIVNRKAIYVKAYCTLREEKRSFRLSRMKIINK